MKRGYPLQNYCGRTGNMLLYCVLLLYELFDSLRYLKFYSAHNDGHCLHLRMLYIARITFPH
jgi:hypothetical protein